MATLRPDNLIGAEAPSLASAVPPGFIELPVTARQQWLDRTLGYFGNRRLVFFYFEPRGEEVVWNDGVSCGFGTGGWLPFDEEVAPLARRMKASVGGPDEAPRDVLLIDRSLRRAYFAPRETAEAWLALHRSMA